MIRIQELFEGTRVEAGVAVRRKVRVASQLPFRSLFGVRLSERGFSLPITLFATR